MTDTSNATERAKLESWLIEPVVKTTCQNCGLWRIGTYSEGEEFRKKHPGSCHGGKLFEVGQIATHRGSGETFIVCEVALPRVSFLGRPTSSMSAAPVLLMADEFDFGVML